MRGLQSGDGMLRDAMDMGAADPAPCRYGASRTLFRGPARDLSGPYLAMLGGTATFGKGLARPFATLVEEDLRLPVANLGLVNGGPDVWLSDPAALAVAQGARLAVVQLTGAEGVGNPLYSVHSRRNDRFLAATPALRVLYPEVEFTEIHFTRHLLQVLHDADPRRFQAVVAVLQENWLARMRALLGQLPQPLLLWLVAEEPLFITAPMVEALRPLAPVIPCRAAGAGCPHPGIAARLIPAIRAGLETATGAA